MVVVRAVAAVSVLVAWFAVVAVGARNPTEMILGTVLSLVLFLRLVGYVCRDAASAWGQHRLWWTLEYRVGPEVLTALAVLWVVAVWTPYRIPVMVASIVVAVLVGVVTELVAHPSWVTWQAVFAVVVVGLATCVALMIAAVVIGMILVGCVITLLIGAGLARRAWR